MYLEEMLSVGDVANVLNCSIYTVRRRLKSGELKGFHDGGTWKIPKSSYHEYINSRMLSAKISTDSSYLTEGEDRRISNELSSEEE